MFDMEALTSGLAAFLVAVLITRWMVNLGPRWGWVDVPDATLKIHRRPVPPLGGVGVFSGLQVGLAMSGSLRLGLLVSTGLLLAVGLVDDRRGLPPWLRLLAAVAAGWMVGWDAGSGWREGLVGAGLAVVVVNAVNLWDGLDGLAGSTLGVTGLGLAGLAWLRGGDGVAGLVLAGALVGFLVWNRPPARIFLGDNGAYVTGITLTWLVMRTASDPLGWAVGSALVGLPLADLAITVVRRSKERRPLFEGDRDHTYDRLARRWSIPRVVLSFAAFQGVWCGLVVWGAASVGDLPTAVAGLVAGAGVVAVGVHPSGVGGSHRCRFGRSPGGSGFGPAEEDDHRQEHG